MALTIGDVLVTSEAGDRWTSRPDLVTSPSSDAARIEVDPDRPKQTLLGIGTSFTESSAYVLAHLPPAERARVMARIYGPDGADIAFARTHIGACDFCVDGRYGYAPTAEDMAAGRFSVDVDAAGFSRADHPGIQDEAFDLLPMIQEARALRAGREDLRIVASAWSAPPWMKDIGDWYRPAGHGRLGTGGQLKPEHQGTYADYLLAYLSAYAERGVPIWGLTPVNEPHGNNGQWESMHFSPESQRDFIAQHLGPKLAASPHRDVALLIFDQNRDEMERWAHTILGDPAAARYVRGTAIHWYSSTEKVYEDLLDRVHAAFPDFAIVHTEGCIDDLGKPAPPGVLDPERFQESGWFGNDAFWWQPNATDWAYTATWAPNPEDHPIYTPTHRYARDIIVGIDHWMNGWIDWNVVLDAQGGPNHVGNFCGAPIMIDRATGQVHETPVFQVLGQLSRTIRPGDRALSTRRVLAGLSPDDLHACATRRPSGEIAVQLLNTTQVSCQVDVQVGDSVSGIAVPPNSVVSLIGIG